MNKRKKAQIQIINRLSFGPILLLPELYWCMVKMQRFQAWYLIPLIVIPLGLLLNQLVLYMIKKRNPDLLKIKNEQGFKLSHFAGAISVFSSLLLITILNVYITIESEKVNYKINSTGERGSGRKKQSYVEVVLQNGDLEKINLAKNFVQSLENEDSVNLVRHTSAFGLVYHDRY